MNTFARKNPAYLFNLCKVGNNQCPTFSISPQNCKRHWERTFYLDESHAIHTLPKTQLHHLDLMYVSIKQKERPQEFSTTPVMETLQTWMCTLHVWIIQQLAYLSVALMVICESFKISTYVLFNPAMNGASTVNDIVYQCFCCLCLPFWCMHCAGAKDCSAHSRSYLADGSSCHACRFGSKHRSQRQGEDVHVECVSLNTWITACPYFDKNT